MDQNFAEIEQRVRDNPSDRDCFRMGHTHFHYGWSRSPWGHWTDEQKAQYDAGYDAAKGGK
ncbi:hypothetical protein RWE87_13545 [Sinorhizobium meliloti]|uniref:hypothetical protein n=1 Tax=Rhizobium meliloti TaxID=382 RepID=UPI00299F3D39|nr:hypothetical protein [Sinorhizobium meliloti]